MSTRKTALSGTLVGVLSMLAALLLVSPILAQTGKKTTKRAVGSSWDVEAREYLGTPQSEAAVDHGLAYLAGRQLPDGHWVSGNFRSEVAITGLCLMAYLATGHQPGRGRYGLVLNEAVDYLASNVRMDGQFAQPGLIRSASEGHPMYGHGFALLALAEVYGMTHRRDLRPKLQAAIKLIEDTQSRNGRPFSDGGWRYQPVPDDADLSVTVVQVLALRACRNAGLQVSQAVIDRAIAYMERMANADGGFSYQLGQNQSDPARAGAGFLSLVMAGRRDTPKCEAAIQYLVKHPLGGDSEWQYRDHYHYAIYYVTQAMYQAGGEYWKQWYPVMRDRLVRTQDSDGSWSRSENNSEAGVEYATAMSVLVLQVPAGLLPIYQK